MKCIDCHYLDLRKNAKLSYHGFGFCTLTIADFPSVMRERDCQYFTQIDKAKAEKRIEWYETKRQDYA